MANEVPEILTSAEAARFLRLDEDHPEIADAVTALHRIVRTGALRPIRGCGKSHKFTLAEVRRYAHEATAARDPGAGDVPLITSPSSSPSSSSARTPAPSQRNNRAFPREKVLKLSKPTGS